MDIRPNSEGITGAESNEQQRNWDDKHWEKKASDSLANYDPTRKHLNFEVVKGGIVQPIDTSKTIAEKMKENLLARGINDPNDRPNVRRRQRTLAQFIFGGSRERMLEMAFGNQSLDTRKGADNSHLTRESDIEKWAQDVYGFVARKFGEDNIVSFYVHLDETNPHCHCTVIPFDEENNKISWRSVFGKGHSEGPAIIASLHDDLEKEVNSKWNLSRGDSKEETKAKHLSTEEYKRELIHTVVELSDTVEGLTAQIRTLERKVKSLSTMLENLEKRKEEIQDKLDTIREQFGNDEIDDEQLAKLIDEQMQKMDGINEKIDIRQQMLDETTAQLEDARIKLAALLRKNESMEDIVRDKNEMRVVRAERDVSRAYNTMVAASFQQVKDTLTPTQKEILEESGFTDLLDNGQPIMNCAILLFFNYIDKATTYAQSHGGGGGHTSGWGRSKDDDDDRWWLKCISKAAEMTAPSGRKTSRRR